MGIRLAPSRIYANQCRIAVLPALTKIGYRLLGPQASERPEPGPPPITREGLYK